MPFYTTETWEEHQKQHHYFFFNFLDSLQRDSHVVVNTKSSTKSYMVAKSKKYFLLDYKFIIFILFMNLFSVVSMQDGCFASVMLKPNIALLLSLAAEGIYLYIFHMAGLALLHSCWFTIDCSEMKLGPTP